VVFGFFVSFFSTFAASPLGAYTVPDLDLSKDYVCAANTYSRSAAPSSSG
jgi:hypothetical protein